MRPVRTPRRSGARTVLVLAATMLASLAVVAEVPAPRPAQAAEDTDLVTTASTRTVKWSEQNPRHPDDGPDAADPAVYKALEPWSLRVSQTEDLLNQTVQVSWEGAANGFLQLMQCWSDGPDKPPTREQCAYGGTNLEGAEGSGAARTRGLRADPRERTYRNDGGLNPVTVDGAVPPGSWPAGAELVLGTNAETCPAGTVGYAVTLVPPRDAVKAGQVPASVVVQAPATSLPGSLTRDEGGFARTYATVIPPFRLTDVATQNGIGDLPVGQYRIQLGCTDGAGAEVGRFVGYLEQAESDGARVWRPSAREGGVFVPFDPLGDTSDTAPTDPYVRDEVLEYIKPRSTNEIWQARTRPDGGGSVFLETLTDLEAQHLGCGRVEGATVRSCWLVAVPRWLPEPDGTYPIAATFYSPLSQTLWDRRIAVPLEFAPIAAGCRIGSGLKQILAHDSALTALRSWQPTFCRDSATASSVLGPLQDVGIRAGVAQPNRMGVVGIPPEDAATVVKAPISTSGVVVGFAADRQILYGSEKFALNETRATVMNLNARLVAKLLSQSYDTGAAPNGGKTSGYNSSVRSGGFAPTFTPARSFPANNPRTLYDDPEFLRLNPDFADWLGEGGSIPPTQMADVLVAASDTDAYQVLWQWVLGDPAAASFLDGGPDPDGMLVNPYYKGQLTEATSSFPLLDPTCVDDIEQKKADAFPLLCQINNHPRVEDDTDAAQAGVRGDTKRVNVAPLEFTGAPGEILSYKPEARQQQGRLGMLVITTSAIAERFGLPTARLQNADGTFVPATAASMATAREQMPARSDGVLVPDPAKVRDGGYPLTTNSYAMVDVAATTQAQNDAFASILSYAADDGQRTGTAIGQLPPGYAPLSPALAAQTRSAVALLRDPSSLLPEEDPPAEDPAPAATEPNDSAPGDSAAPPAAEAQVDPQVDGPVDALLDAPSPLDVVAPGPPAPPATTVTDAPQVARPVATTSGSASPLRWTVPVLLLVGLLAALGGRVLSPSGGLVPPNHRLRRGSRRWHLPLPPRSNERGTS